MELCHLNIIYLAPETIYSNRHAHENFIPFSIRFMFTRLLRNFCSDTAI